MMLCLGAVGGASFVTPMTAMAAVAQDQVITVKGQVVDDQGEPLIGATVKTKDAKTGAVTDLDGNFEIKVKLTLLFWLAIWASRSARLPFADVLSSNLSSFLQTTSCSNRLS